MPADSPRLVGIGLVVGMMTFGTAAIMVRLANTTDALVLSTMRTVFATAILFPFWIRYGRKTEYNTAQKAKVFSAGLILGLHFLLWTASLNLTSVAAASVLVTSHPVMLLVAERFFFGRKFTSPVWLGVALAVAGSGLLSLSQPDANADFPFAVFGNLLAFLSAIAFAGYALLGSSARKSVDLIDFMMFAYFGSAVSSLGVSWIYGDWSIPVEGWLVALGLAIGPQLIGHGAVALAIKHVSPTLLSTTILAEPLLASFFAFLLFSEMPGDGALAGMIMVLFGIILTWNSRFLPKKQPTGT